MEKWIKIKNFEDYEINEKGEIKNKFGKNLKERISKLGYNRVRLYNNKEKIIKNCLVHRLVAFCFIDNIDNTKNLINHKDGNKLNNNVDNLEWCNHKENMIHNIYVLKNKIKNIKLIKDNKFYEFESIKEASDSLNIDSGCLCRLNNDKRKTCKGYKKYKGGN